MRYFAGLLVCFFCLAAAADEVRTWTKAQGERFQAQFLREVDGDAYFLQNGKPLTVSLDQLSENDQKLIRELEQGKKVEDTPIPLGAPVSTPPPTEEPAAKPDKTIDRRPSLVAPRVVAELRNWRDTSGKTTTSAKFTRIHDGNVVLTRSSGRVSTMSYRSLSREDQQYIRGLLAARGESHLCPPQSEDNPESAADGFVAAAPTTVEFPDGAPELTGPLMAGPTPLHEQTRGRFGQPLAPGEAPDGEPSAGETAPSNLDVVALQPPTNTEASTVSQIQWPQFPKLTGKQIGALIIVSAISLIVGSTLGSAILRTAIWLFNSVAGISNSRDAVPEPTYGEGVGIIFVTIIMNTMAGFGSTFAVGFCCALARIEQQDALLYARIASMPLALLVMSGMFSSMLPTSFFRGLAIAIGYIVLWIFIVAAILIGMFAFGFRMS